MEWINVKDRLPEKGDMICYCSKSKYISCTGIYFGDKDDPRGPIPSMPKWLSWEDVTHWMNLNEPQ